jgi:superfamily II DNA or RNA helicase
MGERLPDWGFQEVAISNCLDALKKQRGRKLGLIVPTGGGKTSIALRIALATLHHNSGAGRVIWVTHRKNLRDQARRELQRMASAGVKGLPSDAVQLLTERFEFVMISNLAGALSDSSDVLLVVVDEAHHAAAASYAPLFDCEPPVSVLALTATPNRTDTLPIGIDEIAFQITYRELVERGVVLMPEFQDFPVINFDWGQETIDALAEWLIEKARVDYSKTLVIAPLISKVEAFYDALTIALARASNHILAEDDIGFVHGLANSSGVSAEEFLAEFASKPRGIIVSAQMLLEGFDDPQINTVVITYPSGSLLLLMQAAGRCVRFFPSKQSAFVVQARNDHLAYHFEQRWLYQEISDLPRPALIDIVYDSEFQLREKVSQLLESHNVEAANAEHVLAVMSTVAPGELCRILLCGLPYFGTREEFSQKGEWISIAETRNNSEMFRYIFNETCARGIEFTDTSALLLQLGARWNLTKDLRHGSDWISYNAMLISMREARREVYEDGAARILGESRPFEGNGATTWLKYVSFEYRPNVPVELSAFLADCYNRDDIVSAYLNDRDAYSLALKVQVPMTDEYEAHLLDAAAESSFAEFVEGGRSTLSKLAPAERFGALAAYVESSSLTPVPNRVFRRLEQFLTEDSYAKHTTNLAMTTGAPSSGSTLNEGPAVALVAETDPDKEKEQSQ